MDIETIYALLIQKPGATESCPFGPQTVVLKVMGKMFALLSIEKLPHAITLKCDPERALLLREEHAAVQPGYHMNKKHWNTVYLDGSVPAHKIADMIDHSYKLVVARLRRADRETLSS